VKDSQFALLLVQVHRHLHGTHVHTKSHGVRDITERGPESAVSGNIAQLAAGVILFSSKLLLTCVKLSKWAKREVLDHQNNYSSSAFMGVIHFSDIIAPW